jgi:hypothetical protein
MYVLYAFQLAAGMGFSNTAISPEFSRYDIVLCRLNKILPCIKYCLVFLQTGATKNHDSAMCLFCIRDEGAEASGPIFRTNLKKIDLT